METTSKLWKNFYPRLGEVDVRNPLKNAVIKQTMRPHEYSWRAKEIFENLKPKSPFLEIGCGYGGLAHEILKIRKVSYTVVDNEPMLNQAKKLLGNRVTYVDAKDIKILRKKRFGLFISYNCLSETPFEYRDYIFRNILENCRKVSILDIEDKQTRTIKMVKEGWEPYPAITEYYLDKYFIINKKQFCRHKAYYLFTGERRKGEAR